MAVQGKKVLCGKVPMGVSPPIMIEGPHMYNIV